MDCVRVYLLKDEPNKSILVPVCLPFNNGVKPLVPGTDKLTVIGYGRINNDRSEARRNVLNFTASTAIMQKLDLPLRTGDTCADKFGKSNWDRPELRLCAGGEPGKSDRIMITQHVLHFIHVICTT